MSNLVQTGRKALAGRQKPQWKSGERGWRGGGLLGPQGGQAVFQIIPFSLSHVALLSEERDSGRLGWWCFSVNGVTSLPLTEAKYTHSLSFMQDAGAQLLRLCQQQDGLCQERLFGVSLSQHRGDIALRHTKWGLCACLGNETPEKCPGRITLLAFLPSLQPSCNFCWPAFSPVSCLRISRSHWNVWDLFGSRNGSLLGRSEPSLLILPLWPETPSTVKNN